MTADREAINSGLQFVEAEVVVCAPQVLETVLGITRGAKSSVHTIIVMGKVKFACVCVVHQTTILWLCCCKLAMGIVFALMLYTITVGEHTECTI